MSARPARLPENETDRLKALRDLKVLDTRPEAPIDEITDLVSTLTGCPIALVSLVDEDRQWFKSARGLGDVCETGRDVAFCAHAILNPDDILEVRDAKLDSRFAANPLVTGEPHIRFYAGVPLVLSNGYPVGTLCAIDMQPRELDEISRLALRNLARVTVHLLETRRHQADATRLGHLMRAATNEVYVVDPETLDVSYANPAAVDALGATVDDVVGAGIADLQINAPVDVLRRIVDDGEDKNSTAYEARHQRADGSTYAVQAIAQLSDAEDPPAILVVAQDVQQQLDAKAALEQQERHFQSLYNRTPVMLHSIDAGGKLLSVSDHWLDYLGYERSDVIGRASTDFLTEESRRVAKEVVLPEFMKTGECWQVPYQMIKRDGTVIEVELSAVANRDANGDIVSTSAAVIDVSERNRARAALEEAKAQLESQVRKRTKALVDANRELLEQADARERLQGELVKVSRLAGQAEVATGVLHNVGNVLNSLNVSASVVKESLRGRLADNLRKLDDLLPQDRDALVDFFATDSRAEQVRTYVSHLARHTAGEQERLGSELKSIDENIDHIRQIIAQQQQYAMRVGVDEPLELARLVDEVIEMSAVARHRIEVVRRYEEVPEFHGDKHKVLQILLNLIGNAKQALKENAGQERLLHVSVERHRDTDLRVVVGDNGPGIPADNREKVFTFGFTTKAGGHGFGLHASANAASELGGKLELIESHELPGAAFALTLPIPAGQ